MACWVLGVPCIHLHWHWVPHDHHTHGMLGPEPAMCTGTVDGGFAPPEDKRSAGSILPRCTRLMLLGKDLKAFVEPGQKWQ